jgi:hypothetical protein
LGNVLLLDLFVTRSLVDSLANPTDDASRVCQFFSYNDCITANRNGLILDGEVLIGYGDAIAWLNNDLPECAGGWRLSGCEKRCLKRSAACSRLQEFIRRVNSEQNIGQPRFQPS